MCTYICTYILQDHSCMSTVVWLYGDIRHIQRIRRICSHRKIFNINHIFVCAYTNRCLVRSYSMQACALHNDSPIHMYNCREKTCDKPDWWLQSRVDAYVRRYACLSFHPEWLEFNITLVLLVSSSTWEAIVQCNLVKKNTLRTNFCLAQTRFLALFGLL
jgi:hypothetical protein